MINLHHHLFSLHVFRSIEQNTVYTYISKQAKRKSKFHKTLPLTNLTGKRNGAVRKRFYGGFDWAVHIYTYIPIYIYSFFVRFLAKNFQRIK